MHPAQSPFGPGSPAGRAGIEAPASGGSRHESEPGRGTSFEILLQRVDEPTAPGSDPPLRPAARACAPDTPPGQATILVVEADGLLRNIYARILEGSGRRTLTAENAARAIEVARRSARPVALVLTDLGSSGTEGPALRRELSELHPGLRPLFLSSLPTLAGASPEVERGQHAVLLKPFTPDALVAAVDATLDALHPPPETAPGHP
jgi:CheY-like chemotaxis protein